MFLQFLFWQFRAIFTFKAALIFIVSNILLCKRKAGYCTLESAKFMAVSIQYKNRLFKNSTDALNSLVEVFNSIFKIVNLRSFSLIPT